MDDRDDRDGFGHVNRRDLLKAGLVAAGGIAVPGMMGRLVSPAVASARPDIAVVRGTPPQAVVDAALEALGGIQRFVRRGDVVVVKPNIGWDRQPEFAANTNPDVVAALVRHCIDAGAKTVKVFDRTVNNARRCYTQSGIADAAEAAGAVVSFIDDRRFRDVPINGLALSTWPLYIDILEADVVINVPIAKHHGIGRLTLGMKNWMGVMGGWRVRIHQRLNASIVDLASVIRPALTVIDAIRILVANGPQGGRLEDVRTLDTIIAGTDPVAVDTLAAALFDRGPADLPYLELAQAAGLGTTDLDKKAVARIAL